MHYFDYNATAPLEAAAREAWLSIVDNDWANPSGVTRFSARAHHRLESCRAEWAATFSVTPAQVVFMGGATEVNNAVISHVAGSSSADSWVAVSAVEHPCVLLAAERSFGRRVVKIPVDRNGCVELDALEAHLKTEPIALVAVMAANNETGVLPPVETLAALSHQHGAKFHCDAAQWLGKRPVAELPEADFTAWSAHKFGGPRGMGGLILAPGERAFRGRVGGAQEGGHQAGTEDVAGIAAMTAAFRAQPAAGWPAEGRDAFVASLADSPFRALGAAVERLPNTVSLLVPRHRSTRWVTRLEKHGWIVANGSACQTGKSAVSHVLTAMGLDAEEANRVLRLSGGPRTSWEEWKALRAAMDQVLQELDDEAGADALTTVVEI